MPISLLPYHAMCCTLGDGLQLLHHPRLQFGGCRGVERVQEPEAEERRDVRLGRLPGRLSEGDLHLRGRKIEGSPIGNIAAKQKK